MTKTDLQTSGMAGDRPSQDNLGLSGSKAAGLTGGKASDVALTLIAPEDCSVTGESFAGFITGLLPSVSLDIRSEMPFASSDRRPTLILTDDPVMSLARRIHDGASPDQAFVEWKNLAAALLAFQRRDRQNIFLVNPGVVDLPVSRALTNLIARLKKISPQTMLAPLESSRSQVASESLSARIPSPEAIVLAVALLGDQSAEEIVQELRTATFGAVEARDTQVLAMAAWKNAQESETLRVLLCEQLRLETERLGSDRKRLEMEVASAQMENERLRNAAALLETEKLHAEVECKQLLAEKTSIEKRYANAQGRIDALLASHSWKITRPLRAVKRLSSFRRKD